MLQLMVMAQLLHCCVVTACHCMLAPAASLLLTDASSPAIAHNCMLASMQQEAQVEPHNPNRWLLRLHSRSVRSSWHLLRQGTARVEVQDPCSATQASVTACKARAAMYHAICCSPLKIHCLASAAIVLAALPA